MKKFLIVIMTVFMLFGAVALVSCDDKEKREEQSSSDETTDIETVEGGGVIVEKIGSKDAYTVFQSANGDMEKWDNYELTMTQIQKTEYGESIIATNIKTVLKLDGQKVYVKTESKDTPYMDSEMWFVDGISYISSMGEKYYEKSDFEDFMLGVAVDADIYSMDITAEEFKKTTVVKYSDGTYGIRFDMIKDFAEEMSDESDIMEELADITEFVYEIELSESGKVIGLTLNMEFGMEMGGIHVNSKSETNFVFENVGKTIVSAPEDADDYEELETWIEEDFDIPDMSDWTEEEIESWYDSYFGEEE